jgi:hypothetical protein
VGGELSPPPGIPKAITFYFNCQSFIPVYRVCKYPTNAFIFVVIRQFWEHIFIMYVSVQIWKSMGFSTTLGSVGELCPGPWTKHMGGGKGKKYHSKENKH